jgi:hypothetical protein
MDAGSLRFIKTTWSIAHSAYALLSHVLRNATQRVDRATTGSVAELQSSPSLDARWQRVSQARHVRGRAFCISPLRHCHSVFRFGKILATSRINERRQAKRASLKDEAQVRERDFLGRFNVSLKEMA